MLWVIAFACGLWLLGFFLKVPKQQRWLLIAILFLAVILIQLTLPSENSLRVATGDLRSWALFAGFVGLIVAYRYALNKLKKRAGPNNEDAPKSDKFSDAELARYARHIMLREVGGPGQKQLKNARVLVVGAGGLGSPALLYLAASGVGTIGVIDGDDVDDSNLQRQVIHTEERVEMAKVFSAEIAMKAINQHINIKPYYRNLDEDFAKELLAEYDLVLDGTDNFETRYLVNRAACATQTPLISAAITQWEGQISLFDPANDGPCYQCVFPKSPAPGMVPSCAEAGVISPLPGVLGTMMALEAVKHITGAGQGLSGRLMMYDALFAETRVIKVARRTNCEICGSTQG
ncbi:Probable molybdopterin biosynthesis protein [Rhodobacteraceae bacterium HTCC2150]|nr:Probable molybdopterin biosynthesis protein [Rhodobacteraceae bacterium HTCC2150]